MSDLNLLRDRRRQAMLAAASRWRARTVSRTADQSTVAAFGAGAADSPMRQARFSARQAVFSQAARVVRFPFSSNERLDPHSISCRPRRVKPLARREDR